MSRIALLLLALCLTLGTTIGCKEEGATTTPTTTDTDSPEGDMDADGDANKTDADEDDPMVK